MSRMKPSEICYIQSDVSGTFKAGKDGQVGKELLTTFEELVQGKVKPSDLGPIEVVPYQGKNYAYEGNRRLVLFKRMESAGLLDEIDVTIKPRNESGIKMKYSTKDDGQSIKVRGNPNFDEEMNGILHK